VRVEIKNPAETDLGNWRPVLLERAADGALHDLITCGSAPVVPAGYAQTLLFFGDSDTQSVAELDIRDERMATLAKVCFAGLEAIKC
jgi:hypothetical protein